MTPQLITPPRRALADLGEVIGAERLRILRAAADDLRRRLNGRTVWQINSTATGGGVAEMLQVLMGYLADAELPTQWLVVGGEGEFFEITKRLHNRMHGASSGPPLTEADAAAYARTTAVNAAAVAELAKPGDLVVLHDPQTAGMAPLLASRGITVIWRCHIGADRRTPVGDEAWEFLRPHLLSASAYVFSLAHYRPDFLPEERTVVIPPSIDPIAPKNAELDPGTVEAVLRACGVIAGGPDGPARFLRRDGRPGEVTHTAKVLADELPALDEPMLVQISRWDRLKDMAGVLTAFAERIAPGGPGCLVLAGPQVDEVGDDPEGAQVYAECQAVWQALPRQSRRRAVLASLPMEDLDENAVMVNALQRHSVVIAQKSLAEGFGLTVAEAMWKRRPVVGSAVGGILDQLADGRGVLVEPADAAGFAGAVRRLIDDPAEASRMGIAAHEFVHREYLGDRHLLRWAELIGRFL
ncbi:MAG: glycosyltransferase [Hamadaea sp.]|uniref:glycosyltransferase n=1 Tax=Hamadaea sp. TaxID=2024425 RepID=UPI00182F79BE|nr:glycosyltransferase [Hamadaea sp.]NUR69911.1 glycosyltransferase [Hamadaea sp.]NUT22515.1 glycosyltransferase [Hamadaea sp.]